MKPIILLLSVLLLAGCETIKKEESEPRIIEKIQYVLKIPPRDLIDLPPQVPPINVDESKQSDIARWILLSEERTRKLENMLIELATFFKLEQLKLDEEAAKKNAEAAAKAAEPPASAASSGRN
jgi:hypothetical protein